MLAVILGIVLIVIAFLWMRHEDKNINTDF